MKTIHFTLMATFLLGGCAGTEEQVVTSPPPSQVDAITVEGELEPEEKDKDEQVVSATNQIGGELNILALAQYNENLSIFSDLVRAADLGLTLENPGEYTVFAPTNEAFRSLPPGTLEILKDPVNKAELTRIILSHIIEDKVMASGLKDNMELKTDSGEKVKINSKNGNITVGQAKIIKSDIDASNGVVHIINKVLVPPRE